MEIRPHRHHHLEKPTRHKLRGTDEGTTLSVVVGYIIIPVTPEMTDGGCANLGMTDWEKRV